MQVDLADTEYAMPGEIEAHLARVAQPRRDIPPRTGPELAAMRLDSMEARLRLLEHRLGVFERVTVGIDSEQVR